jgi:hypothetical protein
MVYGDWDHCEGMDKVGESPGIKIEWPSWVDDGAVSRKKQQAASSRSQSTA